MRYCRDAITEAAGAARRASARRCASAAGSSGRNVRHRRIAGPAATSQRCASLRSGTGRARAGRHPRDSRTPAWTRLSQQTRMIPIVFMWPPTRSAAGFVESLRASWRQCHRLHRCSNASLAGKWLELLKEIAPGDRTRWRSCVNPETGTPQANSSAVQFERLPPLRLPVEPDHDGARKAANRGGRSRRSAHADTAV